MLKRKPMCKEKVTHHNSHLDEIVGDMMATNHGDEKFPGISIAPLTFLNSIDYNKDPEEFLREGRVLFGLGGGDYDEHCYDGKKGRGGCCASLVARDLEIEDRSELIKVLDFVTENDTKGKSWPFDAANVLRAIHHLNPTYSLIGVNWIRQGFGAHIRRNLKDLNKPREITNPQSLVVDWMDRKFGRQLTEKDDPALKYILRYGQQKRDPEKEPFLFDINALAQDLTSQRNDWIDLGLNAKYEEQKEFITLAADEFKKNATFEMVGNLRIATIVSNNKLVARYARSQKGGDAIAVVIQIQPADREAGNGFIQIHPDPQFRLSLDGITLAIRKAELIAQGMENLITDEELLMAEGTLRKSPHWYRHLDLGLYNGALSLTVPGSKIEDRVLGCVIDGLRPKPVSDQVFGVFRPKNTAPLVDSKLQKRAEAVFGNKRRVV